MSKTKIDVVLYPGKSLSPNNQEALVSELKNVAKTCFSEVPNYQVLSGQKKDLDKAVIALARGKNGELLGFCSALIFEIKGVGKVFHTGLTCVTPKARGLKLTHKLTSKVLLKFLISESPFQGVWISNCACVLSSIGNIAKYFDEVYPSPFNHNAPSSNHLYIANEISKNYREEIAINKDAFFNTENFVFEGSVVDTVFQKDSEDKRYHHRDKELTSFYMNLLNFERGDEVLQIGRVSLLTFPKYLGRQILKKIKVKPKATLEEDRGLYVR